MRRSINDDKWKQTVCHPFRGHLFVHPQLGKDSPHFWQVKTEKMDEVLSALNQIVTVMAIPSILLDFDFRDRRY